MIDVGTGVERELGISKEKMNQALYIWKWKAITSMAAVSLR